jgi:hypothetical protein
LKNKTGFFFCIFLTTQNAASAGGAAAGATAARQHACQGIVVKLLRFDIMCKVVLVFVLFGKKVRLFCYSTFSR